MMKIRALIVACLLALSASLHAEQYSMDIELMNGTTVSYSMEKVKEVIYDNGHTVIYLYGEETVSMVIYKDEDIKAIKWSVKQ